MYNNKLSLNVIKKIIAEIAIAVDFLHNHCNLVHCNLKPENIMFKFSEEEMVR